MLDKLTLHAQLVILSKNAETLDAAIKEKISLIERLTTDLERTRGARQYHDLVVQQINNALAEAERESAIVPPSV